MHVGGDRRRVLLLHIRFEAIVSSDGMIYMLCDDGFVEWDGRDKHSTQATVTEMA